jgi:hypothetical protein
MIAVAFSALAFFLLCEINDLLFQHLAYSPGVSWIFLPSGLRLLLVLMLALPGAIGVMLGSLLAGLSRSMEPELALAAAFISGLSPWLARWVCLRTMHIKGDLKELSALQLLQMALVFAAISAVLHQTLYVAVGLSQSFLHGTAVMAVGDKLGTLVVLYLVKLALRRWWR